MNEGEEGLEALQLEATADNRVPDPHRGLAQLLLPGAHHRGRHLERRHPPDGRVHRPGDGQDLRHQRVRHARRHRLCRAGCADLHRDGAFVARPRARTCASATTSSGRPISEVAKLFIGIFITMIPGACHPAHLWRQHRHRLAAQVLLGHRRALVVPRQLAHLRRVHDGGRLARRGRHAVPHDGSRRCGGPHAPRRSLPVPSSWARSPTSATPPTSW